MVSLGEPEIGLPVKTCRWKSVVSGGPAYSIGFRRQNHSSIFRLLLGQKPSWRGRMGKPNNEKACRDYRQADVNSEEKAERLEQTATTATTAAQAATAAT